ncbi:MAG: hypothetical protein ACT6FG_00250 [Methanosarcinaceae archaeon]
MSYDYVSHCKTCGLTLDQGNDGLGIRHDLFELLHQSQHINHIITRISKEQWFDDWHSMRRMPPQRLYCKKKGKYHGYVIQIPDWVCDYIGWDRETRDNEGIALLDQIDYIIESNKQKIIDEMRIDYLYRLMTAKNELLMI